MVSYHAQMRLQLNLKPLEGALQLLHLCASCHQGLCLCDHFLLHGCKLHRAEEQHFALTQQSVQAGHHQVKSVQLAPPTLQVITSHLVLVPRLQVLAVLGDDGLVVLPDF